MFLGLLLGIGRSERKPHGAGVHCRSAVARRRLGVVDQGPDAAMFAAALIEALAHQNGHATGPAVAHRADAGGIRNADIGQEGFVEIRGARYLADRAHVYPRRLHVEHEEGQTLVLGNGGIGAGDQNAVIGMVRPA